MISKSDLERISESIEVVQSENTDVTVVPAGAAPVLATPVAAVAFGAGVLFTLAKGMQTPLEKPNNDIFRTEHDHAE